jgi:L-threonylcarbamoyladenylate synthase
MPLVTRDVEEVAALLRRGGVAVYPTETYYALGALLSAPEAVERVAASKLRPEGKPLPLIAADRDMAFSTWKAVLPQAAELAARFWPGPLTLVAAAAPGLPRSVASGGTVGVRVPGCAVARELSRLCGAPLVSTSANLAGGQPVACVEDLDPAILGSVEGVLDGGPAPGGLPSTVVEVAAGGLTLLRAGAVPWVDILVAVGGSALPSDAE